MKTRRNDRGKSIRLWAVAIVLTLASAVWQRTTGPTYPRDVDLSLAGATIEGELLRSQSVSAPLPVVLGAPDTAVVGEVLWRRFPVDEPWRRVPLEREGDRLVAELPAQPAAGKVEYSLVLRRIGDDRPEDVAAVPDDGAVVARFKGDVPPWVLAPHILLMFLGMLWSNRTALEALAGGPRRARMALTTLLLLAVGGLVLGPIVQKYAFGAFWTGWPLGEDLTDNKLAVAVLAWVWASWRKGDGRWARATAVIAALVVLAVYMIPHSLHGSTLDYASLQTIQG